MCSEAVTDGHINAAARSLAQTRTDLAARMAEVDALSSAAHDDDGGKGFFSMFTSSPNAASEYNWTYKSNRNQSIDQLTHAKCVLKKTEIKSLQGEIKGLEIMESQMSHVLQLMKRRKEIGELSKTWSGKALKALGWAFSVYCIYRVAMVSSADAYNTQISELKNLHCIGTTQPHLWLGALLWFWKKHTYRCYFCHFITSSRSTRSRDRCPYLVKSSWIVIDG